jgi:hypothetical protein
MKFAQLLANQYCHRYCLQGVEGLNPHLGLDEKKQKKSFKISSKNEKSKFEETQIKIKS